MALLDTSPSKNKQSKKDDSLVQEGKSQFPVFLRSGWSFFLEVLKVVVISLAIIIPVKYFLFQPFYVKGASMEPTFYDNEYLIINEIGYRLNDPERGDIVVLRYPKDPSQYFIKRVIGLPGEQVEFRNGLVYIQPAGSDEEFLLDESDYLPAGTRTTGSDSRVLGTDEYYVLGDNRSSSLDSRSTNLGPIQRSVIVGRAWFRLWPVDRFRVFEQPEYMVPI